MGTASTAAWDEFVKRAKAYKATGQLESEEINYKLEIGQQLAAARDAIHTGAENWSDLLQGGLASRQGHPLSWRFVQPFTDWLDQSPSTGLSALQALWTPSNSTVTERIRAFNSILPQSVISGSGTRARFASVLLMGLDVHKYPPYAYRFFKRTFESTGYVQPPQDADEATIYGHTLGFLDRFIDEAEKCELQIHHRLEASVAGMGN